MNRPRDRESSKGLLPRMEARPRKNGQYTYRYHPLGGKPINLGGDRQAALQKVLDMTGRSSDEGTLNSLWRLYQDTPNWKRLADATRHDYQDCALKLLPVFGEAHAGAIRPADIARYLRVERADAPVRANREAALLSNLLNLAVERGDIDANPCRQVRRNTEQPRTSAPAAELLTTFSEWMAKQTPQRRIIGMMAEYASLAGSRRMEFLDLSWPQIDEVQKVVRTKRGKQRGGKRGEVIELVEITPKLQALIDRLKLLRAERGVDCLYVFPTRDNNAYTDRGFKTLWARTMADAISEAVLSKADRFTFHDLRAYYTTQHKKERGALPDLHANPATTARVYDRNKEVKRRAL